MITRFPNGLLFFIFNLINIEVDRRNNIITTVLETHFKQALLWYNNDIAHIMMFVTVSLYGPRRKRDHARGRQTTEATHSQCHWTLQYIRYALGE